MNLQFYYVGGHVRDELLHKPSHDIDFVVVINDPISVNDAFSLLKSWLLNNQFTIFLETPSMFTIRAKFPTKIPTIFPNNLNGKTTDFVLSRKEISYPTNTRQPTLTIGTLYDDLYRRDFTINAIAKSLSGEIIDPFQGQIDLQNKLIQTPKPALQTILDDPLRLLRAFRFSIIYNFEIHPDILNTIHNQDVITKLFKVVSTERIREELTKMFTFSTFKSLQLLNTLPEDFIQQLFNNIYLKPTTVK